MHGSLWSVLPSSFPNHFIQSVPVGSCCAAFSARCRGKTDGQTKRNTSRVLLENTLKNLMKSILQSNHATISDLPIHYLQLYRISKWPFQQFHATLFAIRSWCVISRLFWIPSMYRIQRRSFCTCRDMVVLQSLPLLPQFPFEGHF